MSTPTNEQRAETLRERVASVSLAAARGDEIGGAEALALAAGASWALSRIEELAKERDAANAILEELETLTGFTQTALVDEWLCVSKDAARLDWIEQSLRDDVDPRTVYEEPWDEHTPLRDYIDRGMSAASSSGANTA